MHNLHTRGAQGKPYIARKRETSLGCGLELRDDRFVQAGGSDMTTGEDEEGKLAWMNAFVTSNGSISKGWEHPSMMT